MKKCCLALLLGVIIGFSGGAAGMARAAPDAPAATAEKIMRDAWTAYNIGDYRKTLRLIRPLAGDGNPRAQVLLGRCHENGLGVPQDMAVAAQWYQLAAEQNDSEAQVLLAYCYEVGAGVPRNPEAATTLMTRAARDGYAEAQFNLALYYSQGLHQTAKDQKESFRWARLAADQGYAQAERFVGACYEYGIGVQKDPAEAALWYNKAAAQGLARDGNVFNRVRAYSMP